VSSNTARLVVFEHRKITLFVFQYFAHTQLPYFILLGTKVVKMCHVVIINCNMWSGDPIWLIHTTSEWVIRRIFITLVQIRQ
jgi:hypothetical protein